MYKTHHVDSQLCLTYKIEQGTYDWMQQGLDSYTVVTPIYHQEQARYRRLVADGGVQLVVFTQIISRKREKHPDTVCRVQLSDHHDTSPQEKDSHCQIELNCFCLDMCLVSCLHLSLSINSSSESEQKVCCYLQFLLPRDERAFNDLNCYIIYRLKLKVQYRKC